ncbi:MAG: addiction module protein [bacterium]
MASLTQNVIKEGIRLKPAERLILIEALINSLDNPYPGVEKAWAQEAEKRLRAYNEGRLETIRGYEKIIFEQGTGGKPHGSRPQDINPKSRPGA